MRSPLLTRTCGVLLAALGGLSIAACAGSTHSRNPVPSVPESVPGVAQVRGQVPPELVGTWDGGSSGNAAKITFFADGTVRFDYNNGQTVNATAVVQYSSMTLYLANGSQQRINNWSIERVDAGYGYEFLNLSLDGYSYVRQISGG